MKTRLVIGAIAACLVGAPDPGLAQQTLIFAATAAPQNFATVGVHMPWAQRVTERSGGALKIDVRPGFTLTNPSNFYSRVVEDVVQITFGPLSFVAGKFPLSEVVNLPFESESSLQGSVAFWRLYKSGALDSEFNDVLPMYLLQFPQLALHLAKPLRSLDNLNGLKVITTAKTGSETVARLGATPLSISPNESYEALQRGTADGAVFPWAAFQPYRLAEVTSYHVDAELGGGPGAILMSRKRYDALPAAARKVLDDNSQEPQTRVWATAFDEEASKQRNSVKASPAHTIVQLPPDQQKAWRKRVAAVAEEWARATPGGQKTLEAFRKHLADVKAGR
jgi:TRAP-type C4-dicarboxylate transport system substrate-binding protein